jgi:hypothetical protein
VTGLCTISAAGVVLKSIIILKDLKGWKSLLHYNALTLFASSCSGWITGDIFTMFAIDFCSQLNLYHLSLPSYIADEPVLLLLDGHISQRNITVLMTFYLFNVDIWIIPCHTTHVLQPFDVGIAAPFIAEFKQQLRQEINSLAAELTAGQRTKADTLRCHMVAAFLNVFHKVTTPGNLYSAFAAKGFFSFSSTRPLDSPLVATVPPSAFEGIARRPAAVNAELPTDPDYLQHSFAEKNGRVITNHDLSPIDLEAIWNRLMMGEVQSGRILTSRLRIWVRKTKRQARVF